MRFGLILIVIIVAGLWLGNSSMLAEPPAHNAPQFIAHRGVHQTFHRHDLMSDTCTASRIDPPTHGYLENTLPSIEAAFAAAASVVEIDVYLTKDNVLAVFHDRTVDCRTNGTGDTEKQDWPTLRQLDIGYGYTADEGVTYPFRGKGVGLMPRLEEVLEGFPDGLFLINFKSNRAIDGRALAELIGEKPHWAAQIWGVYGGNRPVQAVRAAFPQIRNFSRSSVKSCLKDYMAIGWTGRVPADCRNTVIMVPISHRQLLWGWPNAFLARMEAVGTDVILLGPYTSGDPGTTGIDDFDLLRKVPDHYTDYIWTNKIELLGEAE